MSTERLIQLARRVDAGDLTEVLEKTIPLEKSTGALHKSEAGYGCGKVVLAGLSVVLPLSRSET